MNPANTTNDWSNKWNQTADLTIPTDGNNCYTVAAGTWDNGGGSWSYIPSYYSVSYALTNLTSSNMSRLLFDDAPSVPSATVTFLAKSFVTGAIPLANFMFEPGL